MEDTSLGDFVEDADAGVTAADADADTAAVEAEDGPAVDPENAEDGATADSENPEDGPAVDLEDGPAGAEPSDCGPRDAVPTDEIEAPRPTAVWTPERAACARCEETVHRRFWDGEALVCAGCADW